MPIYEFKCNQCGKTFEKILSSTDISSVTCSACDSPDIQKVMSSGSFRLKNSSSGSVGIPSAPSCGNSGFS